MTEQTTLSTDEARGARRAESTRRVLGFSTLAAVAAIVFAAN